MAVKAKQIKKFLLLILLAGAFFIMWPVFKEGGRQGFSLWIAGVAILAYLYLKND